MTEIKDKSIQLFLEELASHDATPGGGSAAAVMGATAAALTSMVCNLTIGKPKYSAVESDMKALLVKSEVLREKFTAMIKADVEGFNQVMQAYGLPKESVEDKECRTAAIQAALKEATEVPLACARASAEVILLSKEAAEKGNTNVITDAGVSVVSAYAALKSSALNVYINVGSISDKRYGAEKLAELEKILVKAEVSVDLIYESVKGQLL
ncbi:MAG: methenyltetrahydrofolate cyclohydrolase [Methylococcales bacterium]|nr:methenyltetrahydrofolate cyclohydrolase [Methylococcaceae bacterium]HIL41365.1 methenyltetrahydrofolate cyclohydrolase [Methylococcales bacterium]